MKRFLIRLKHNIPWPMFLFGSILLVVSLLLQAPSGIFISGIIVLSSVVLFFYNCALEQAFKEELDIKIKLEEERQRASEAKTRRLYNNLQAQAKKEREE